MGKKTNKLLDRILACLEDRFGDWAPGRPTRPCLVDDKPAVFHRFVEEDRALLQFDRFCKAEAMEAIVQVFKDSGVYCGKTCSTKILHSTLALVEFPDGSLKKVDLEHVTFLNDEYK